MDSKSRSASAISFLGIERSVAVRAGREIRLSVEPTQAWDRGRALAPGRATH